MNTFIHRSSRKRGVALVLVLSALVLITILVLAVVGSVGTFTQAAKTGSNNSSTRSLVDDSVQLVTAQIRDGTDMDQTMSWASQPGMIRTYTNDGLQAQLYKLYSSPNMVIDGKGLGQALIANELPQTDWDKDPAYYTDLNAPVTASNGSTLVFPILDPRAWSNPSTPAAPIPTSSWTGTGVNDVQGFSYFAPIAGVHLPPQNSDESSSPLTDNGARLAMPVQWLYVRKSGYITAPSGTPSGSGSVTVPADPNFQDPVANDASTNPNPIVGRIAFWTDDDTCKININTACGDLWSPENFTSPAGAANPTYASGLHPAGSYWEVPRFSTWYDEWALSYIMPLVHEFQRYAGHPATVYLSAVFPQFSAQGGTVGSPSLRDELYNIVPRVNGGTGPVQSDANGVLNQNTEGGSALPASETSSTYTVTPKHDRLYASIDELLYNPKRQDPLQQVPPNNVITPAALEKAKFFITADSNAPELNLFNLPRISMWPIDSSYSQHPTQAASATTRYTAYDQLIAYCSSLAAGTTAAYDYFFQRSQGGALSATQDWNPPGSNGRNASLYNYLQNLLGQKVPGYGGSLGTKYNQIGVTGGLESNQILTEIMDYIRCINLQDPLLPGAVADPTLQFSGNASPYLGMVLPLRPTGAGAPANTMGFGRFITLSGVGVQFLVTDDPKNSPTPMKENVCAVLVLEGHSISSAIPFLQINNKLGFHVSPVTLKIQQKDGTVGSFIIPGGTVTMAASNASGVNPPFQLGAGDSVVSTYDACPPGPNGPYYGLNLPFFLGQANNYKILSSVGSPVSMTVPTNPSNSSFQLTSATSLTVDIQYNSVTIQTVKVDLSPLTKIGGSGQWNMPTYPKSSGSNAAGPIPVYPSTLTDPSGTMPNGAPVATGRTINTVPDTIASGDSLKEMVPGYPQMINGYSDVSNNATQAGGDFRLIAGMYSSPANLWVAEGNGDPNDPNNAIATTANAISHNFTNDDVNWQYISDYSLTGPSVFPGYSQGSLINVLPNPALISSIKNCFGWGDVPVAPSKIRQDPITYPYKTEITHDFDQGAGISADGAFINHPEEVTVRNLNNGVLNGGAAYFGNFFTFTDSGTSGSTGSTAEFSTPNRLVPSPGILGSLPSRLAEGIPWQTLLFRAQPEHPGSGGYTGPVTGPTTEATTWPGVTSTIQPLPYSVVPDHLFLDLFWMPVVEPYAISNTFATSGKINMNYQIMPFTYIDRATGMQAVLRSQRMAAVPTNQYILSKQQYPDANMSGSSDPRIDFRHDINLSTTNGGTLMQFENKFAQGDLFRSASQICDIYLVPLPNPSSGNTPAINTGFGGGGNPVDEDAYNWWNTQKLTNTSPADIAPFSGNAQLTGFKLTGDNMREEPYTNIYSLLTTKSNSYTVHMRVQSLQQAPRQEYKTDSWSDPAAGGTDIVTGEYRGSAAIERYLDSSDPNISGPNAIDFATKSVGDTTVSLSPYYKYRVTSTKQFAP